MVGHLPLGLGLEAGLPPAGEAWSEFIRLSSRYANDGPMPDNIPNRILVKTIRAMGWRYLCASTNGMADRARFIELYNEYAKRSLTDYVMPPRRKAGNYQSQKTCQRK